jgi:hypothetical protein
MEPHKLLYVDASVTLSALVDDYILKTGLRKRLKRKDGTEIINRHREKMADTLTEASQIDECDHDSILASLRKTLDVMKDIEYQCSGSDLSEYKNRRKDVEKISSILHIGRTYHNDAMKRLKNLRKKTV